MKRFKVNKAIVLAVFIFGVVAVAYYQYLVSLI